MGILRTEQVNGKSNLVIYLILLMSLETTISHLRSVMPGQTEDWYQRIAKLIQSGAMPMPSVENSAQQQAKNKRILDALTDSKPGEYKSGESSNRPDTTYSYTKESIPDRYRVEPLGTSAKATAPQQPIKTQTTSVKATTKNKLYKLSGNNWTTAERLVSGIRFNNPEKSEQWCWEKACWDLERDRL